MPWSKNKTVPALEGKSDADKELFARVANAQLDKGKSEKDAIIAGMVAAWDFIQNLNSGDYLEFIHAVADTAIELQALPVTGFSLASPSVLIHITQVNQ